MLYQKMRHKRRTMAHFWSMNYLYFKDDRKDSTIDPDLNLKNRHLVDIRRSSFEGSRGSASLRRAATD
jgi:hypothetical protein